MNINLMNELMINLDGKISDEDLKTVINELQMLGHKYDIQEKKDEIIPCDNTSNTYYKMYMVSKGIEGLSKDTLSTYKIYLDNFLSEIRKPLKEINANDIRVYLYNYQQSHCVSNRTMDGHRLILNTFFDWLTKEGFISKNPCVLINPIKFEVKPREPLTDIEFELIRDACFSLRDRAIIETLYSTGCRVSELSGLNKSDVDFRNGEVHLFGKGAKHRTSYINARMEVSLKKYLQHRQDDEDAVFITERRPYRRLRKQSIEKIVRNIGDRAGIGRRVYPHLIRHGFATTALHRGMNVAELQKILGHEKLDTTMIYASVVDSDVKYSHHKYIV